MQPRFKTLSSVCLLLFLLASCFAVGQADSLRLQAPQFSRKIENDPNLLVAALIEGKTSDKEKLEAIFVWVATNIKYDYRLYFSGKGSSAETDISNVLRRKSAICFQYADLMNVLCSLADLHSLTITGYAKDRLFDINDTLYFDNHAWNAVKLDERWYVYDVTWAAGGYEYRMRRFSERVFNWRMRIHTKRKKLKKQKIVMVQEANEFCGIPKHKEKKIQFVLKLPLFWRIVDKILSWKHLRYVIDHGKLENTNFLLTEPRLFAITHFPNVPYWSLTPEISKISEFSADKSYYDFDFNQHLMQDSEGQICLKCDDFFALELVDQEKAIIQQSLANNPRNGLVPSISYFRIAEYFFKDAELTLDSLEKVQGYDSTLLYLDEAKKELKRSGSQNKAYIKLHLEKEKIKVKQLKETNRKHTAVNRLNVTNLRARANRIKSLNTKLKNNQRLYLRDHRALKLLKPKRPLAKEMRSETIEGIEKRQAILELKMDSLNEGIELLESKLITDMNALSDNVWKQTQLIQPQLSNFQQSIYSRVMLSLDDRDKPMVELQDSILQDEQELILSVKNLVLLPADTLYSNFITLHKLIKLRDANQLKMLKLYAQLYTGNSIGLDSLEAVRSRYLKLIQKDYCYFYQHRFPLKLFTLGFKHFKDSHYDLYEVIRDDNKAELMRHKSFVKEIVLNRKRVTHVINTNLKYQARYKRSAMQAKKQYIIRKKKENKKLASED